MLYIVINSVCLSFHYEAGFSGDIMWCDGSCMRAFHCGVEKAAQEDSTTDCDDSADETEVSHSQSQLQPFHCNPLGMPPDLYQRLKDTKDTFHCPNCLTGVHQCFFCKQEGVVEAHAADHANAPFAKSIVFRYTRLLCKASWPCANPSQLVCTWPQHCAFPDRCICVWQ